MPTGSWKKVFGAAIFEPLDEITDGTFVSNPELMDTLEQLMRDLNYDMKAYLAVLCKTRAYQRAVSEEVPALGEPYFFQGPLLRRMSAEQIWDSVVGLVLPEADRYSPNLKRHLEAIVRRRSIFDNLADMPPEKYIATLTDFEDTMSRINSQRASVTQQLAKARTEGNDELVRELKEMEGELVQEFGAKISSIQKMSSLRFGGERKARS